MIRCYATLNFAQFGGPLVRASPLFTYNSAPPPARDLTPPGGLSPCYAPVTGLRIAGWYLRPGTGLTACAAGVCKPTLSTTHAQPVHRPCHTSLL